MFRLTKEEKIAFLFLISSLMLGVFVFHLKQTHTLDFLTYKNEVAQEKSFKRIENELQDKKIVNINTASREELTLLPGIGDSTADKIVIYRKQHNGFHSLEDLKEVKGIGDKKIEKMKDFVTF
jgi:comEA protein